MNRRSIEITYDPIFVYRHRLEQSVYYRKGKMRICSFVNPPICVTRRAVNAGNTNRLHALIAYLNVHIDTLPRRQAYTPWAPSKEARARTNLSRLDPPLKRVLAIDCAPRVTDYLAVQRLQDGSCSDAEIQLAIAQPAVAQVRAHCNDPREWR